MADAQLAPDVGGPSLGALIARPWPQIPADMRGVVERLVAVLHQERGEDRTATWEAQLGDAAHDIVARAISSGGTLGALPLDSSRLGADPAWRRDVEWAVMARASLLWPLSLLVYADVEDIQFLGADRVIVEAGGPKQIMVGPPPEEFSGGSRRQADARLTEWFRQVLSITGVQPRTRLTWDQPQAVVVMPTAVGSARIAVTIEPAAVGRNSVYACIRTPRLSGPTSLDECVALGTMGSGQAAFLRACVAARLNIVISGGTGAGKTTTLVALAREIPEDEVLVTLEDAAELALASPRADGTVIHENTMEMVTVPGARRDDVRVSMEDLGRSALRYLPSRILVGESRGAEMADICNAMTSGHEGSMVTVHANSAAETIPKIVNYVMMAPRFAGQTPLATRIAHQAIQVVVHLAKSQRHAGRKVLTGVTAYSQDGAETTIYSRDDHDAPVRRAGLADLPARVRAALLPHLTEVPPP